LPIESAAKVLTLKVKHKKKEEKTAAGGQPTGGQKETLRLRENSRGKARYYRPQTIQRNFGGKEDEGSAKRGGCRASFSSSGKGKL